MSFQRIKMIQYFGIIFGFLFFWSSVGQAWGLKAPQSGLSSYDIQSEGITRHSLVYSPHKSVIFRSRPVIFVLHGGVGNAEKVRNQTQQEFERLAREHGFFVVYPEAVQNKFMGGEWNDGRDHNAETMKFDDVKYLVRLARKLSRDYPALDANHFFVAGVSNGGMMTQRLACEASFTFKGFASLVAGMPKAQAQRCEVAKTRPILLMAGTEDPLMPYNSEFVHNLRGQPVLGERLTIPHTLSFWKQKNECSIKPYSRKHLPNTNKDDGTTVTRKLYECADSEIHFYRVNNGGHHWFGVDTVGGLGEYFVGLQNQDINSVEEITTFFRTYSSDRANW